jgi:Flp pilus assembly protein TadG
VRRKNSNPGTRRLATPERGAAAVEFALVTVLLLTVLFGILQYSIYFWALQSGSHAAREAARQAAVGELTCAQFRTAVLANAQGENATSVVAKRTYYTDATMTTEALPAVVGGVVKVNVTFKSFDLNFPFIPFINDGLVSEQGVARVENKTSNSVKCP